MTLRYIASRCEHGVPFTAECRRCYEIYEAEEVTLQ